MVNHTPGPWFPHWNGHYFTIDVGPGEYEPAVAHVNLNQIISIGVEEARENARVIAAAPDLLEASENLLFRIRNIGYWNKPDTEMYIKALEAAVARAKGEDNGND